MTVLWKRWSMNLSCLPSPTPDEVIRFQRLYQNRFGILLSEAEALEKAIGIIILVAYYQQTHHEIFPLRSPQQ